MRELLEKKRADDLRRQELVKKFEEALNKMKRSDADSFIASDSDSDSDSTNQNLDKVKKNAKGLMDKKKKLKKNKRKIDGDKENSDNNRMTQEQIGDVNAEEEEAEMSDSSSSDDDSLVIGSDDGNDDEKDVNEDDDTAHKKVKTSENVVKKTYGKKVIPSILPPIDKDTEEVDEQEATGAQDNYDFLDSLDFIE